MTISEKKIRFLALGDSYTCGEAVLAQQSWVALLVAHLQRAGIETKETHIVAKTGWTTADLQAAIDQEKFEPPYDLVSLLIGANNQYRGEKKGYTTASYRTEFAALLASALRFAGGRAERLIVLSIPNYGLTPFVPAEEKSQVAKEICTYNQINKAESQKIGAHYFDTGPVSADVATNLNLTAEDKLHPSAALYQRWVNFLGDEVIRIFLN